MIFEVKEAVGGGGKAYLEVTCEGRQYWSLQRPWNPGRHIPVNAIEDVPAVVERAFADAWVRYHAEKAKRSVVATPMPVEFAGWNV